jgi:hypothetical protein
MIHCIGILNINNITSVNNIVIGPETVQHINDVKLT